MQNSSKWLTGLGIVAGAVVAGVAIAWWAGRDTGPAYGPAGGITQTDPSQPSIPTVPTRPAVPIQLPGDTNLVTGSHPIDPSNVLTNWEDRLDEILTSDTDETNKVVQLFAMFPQLPEEGKVEVAQHLSNLVDDQDYSALGRVLEDSTQPESVLEVLMADLLNRPNGVKLPMFLEVARRTNHPKADEAKELLELYLDEEYGTDWPKWETKLKEWLKENPD